MQTKWRCYCKILCLNISCLMSTSIGFLLPAFPLTGALLTQHPWRHCVKCSGKPTGSSQHPGSRPQALFIMLMSSLGASCIPIIPSRVEGRTLQKRLSQGPQTQGWESNTSIHNSQTQPVSLALASWASEQPPWTSLQCFSSGAPSSWYFLWLLHPTRGIHCTDMKYY